MSTTEETQLTQPAPIEQPPLSAEAARGATAELVPPTTAGMPPTAQTFFAVVDANGALARGFQAASSRRLAIGQYEVIFNHDVTGSAYVATVGNPGNVLVPTPGQVAVVGRAGAPNGVFIAVTDSAGNPADRGFHIAVHS